MDCAHRHTTWHDRDGVEICEDCGDILYEDLG